MKPQPRLIIVGGGLAGGLTALALAERRPDVPFVLVEQQERFGGNHTWSFFDTDVADDDHWLVSPLVSARWPDHEVRFPKRRRTLRLGYNSVRSELLDRNLRERLRPDQYRLGRRIEEVGETHVLLSGGERIDAEGVIDARGWTGTGNLELGWQKFVGRTYQFGEPHACIRPLIMDAIVDQYSGYRFIYALPFNETELLVEDTYYSASPVLDIPLLRGRTDNYVGREIGHWNQVGSEEHGVLPVLLAGDVESLWPLDKPAVARVGLRGGFFHPTTGYSLPDAVRNAALIVEQPDFGTKALHDFYRRRAVKLWSERRFYQLLNRMLFHAAKPSRRYRVLEHFYRLPEALVARFYSGGLTGIDKLRILSGRPPVPVARAIAAMRGRA